MSEQTAPRPPGRARRPALPRPELQASSQPLLSPPLRSGHCDSQHKRGASGGPRSPTPERHQNTFPQSCPRLTAASPVTSEDWEGPNGASANEGRIPCGLSPCLCHLRTSPGVPRVSPGVAQSPAGLARAPAFSDSAGPMMDTCLIGQSPGDLRPIRGCASAFGAEAVGASTGPSPPASLRVVAMETSSGWASQHPRRA